MVCPETIRIPLFVWSGPVDRARCFVESKDLCPVDVGVDWDPLLEEPVRAEDLDLSTHSSASSSVCHAGAISKTAMFAVEFPECCL